MKNILNIIFIITITIILFCCSNKSTKPSDEYKNVIMPLSIGNSWTYVVEHNWETYYRKVVITEKTNINYCNENIEVFVLSWYTYENKSWIADSIYYYYKNEIDGLYNYTPNRKELIAKYPVEVDENWEVPEIITQDSIPLFIPPICFQCISDSEEITTIAGDFDCIEYEEYSMGYLAPQYLYYCPDIGLIKKRFDSVISSYRQELINCDLK